jgi:hypothetical protein
LDRYHSPEDDVAHLDARSPSTPSSGAMKFFMRLELSVDGVLTIKNGSLIVTGTP